MSTVTKPLLTDETGQEIVEALEAIGTNAVHYTAETKTAAEKAVARSNIGITAETWTFTLADSTTVTKSVMVGS